VDASFRVHPCLKVFTSRLKWWNWNSVILIDNRDFRKCLDQRSFAPCPASQSLSRFYRHVIDEFAVLDLIDNHAFYRVSIGAHRHRSRNPIEVLSL